MSKLQALLDELCPDGVEFRRLENCCHILDKFRKPVTKSMRNSGEYPYYGANGVQDYVSDYIFDGVFVLVGEDGSVVTEQGTPVVHWATGKIWVNNHAHIIEAIDDVLLRYLFHCLQTVQVQDLIHGNIPKLTQGDFKELKIPVPPLPVQEEIVRILDAFMGLTDELTEELTLRRKQYAYYRNLLLSFDNVTITPPPPIP
ncbi:MAG: restriction endonuclease subunit S [Oscillibacter sp.]|nr:restriction endonuclease subunit S [Oscillibacter sp.]